MFDRIALFELRYQLRNPVFWVSVAIFFLLGFGLTASSNVSFGTPGAVKENSPYSIAFAQSLMMIFYLFVITSFVANAVVRDDATGFAPMIRATGLTRANFLTGRFLGGLAIAIIGFVAVPLGMGFGVLMPWVDAETVGPGGLIAYLWPFLIIALPNLLFASALLFMLATLTRSMLASYIGVVVFVMAYLIVSSVLGPLPEYREATARFEPFATAAIADVTRYWTSADMNTRLLPLMGNLLFNRIFVIALSAVFLAITFWRYSMTERAPSKRRLRKIAKADARLVNAAAVAPVTGGEAIRPTYGSAALSAQFAARLKTEIMQVLKSPGLIVLLLLAFVFTLTGLIFSETSYGTPSYPLTADIITNIGGAMGLFTIIIAVFYGGELVWRERDTKFNEIIDSTAAPGWVIFIPKILAIFAVLALVVATGIVAGIGYQIVEGVEQIELAAYFGWFGIRLLIDMALLAILAVFVQVLSPNKYLGWGLMLVWFVGGVFLGNLGYDDILYNYASGPSEPLSDMNGAGTFWIGGLWARAYWICLAILLMLVAHLVWPRGSVVAVRPRLKGMGARLSKPVMAIGLMALAGMVGTGMVIHYNTTTLNQYETSDQAEVRTADYERKYLKYENLPRPVVTDIAFDIDLFPRDRRTEVAGRYTLRNDTDAPLREVHVRQSDRTVDFSKLVIGGASLASYDPEHAYRIYRFDTPLAPGAQTTLDFTSQVWRRGFPNGDQATDVVENGSFVNAAVFAPIIGMNRNGLLSDRTQRRRQGLPAELRMAKLEDTGAQRENYVGADWVDSRITLSTDADQRPIAPGNKIWDRTQNGRRTARFESPTPILNFFAIQSARYDEATTMHDGVKLTVYHDPKHDWNVPVMTKAMAASLDYYRRNFGPYQFDYARIVEFPGYQSFAQAFAGTMPYSESIGFAADVRDPETIDYVSYVTAHELAHQYWAHQVVGADMQGSTVTSETLAQYSALMVMKQLYGPDKIRRFLKFELDSYLGARKGEVVEELPLYRVENQGYIHYRKGSLVMYLLQERMGEDAVNRALARFLSQYRFEGPPYHRSVDLIAQLRREAMNAEQQALITDLFERITIYDLKATGAKSTEGANGLWITTIELDAAKYYADGKGKETRAPLAEGIEIGLFASRPGDGAFDAADVLYMKRMPVKNGRQKITVASKTKPAFAGIDPYNFYIDRNSDDNVVAVD